MSMRNFRLKLLKAIKSVSEANSRNARAQGGQTSGLNAWLVMRDGSLSEIDFGDGRDLAWLGLQSDSRIFVYVNGGS